MITLAQSSLFRLPFVRRALGLDYTGATLPPPPADAVVDPNPSIKDTWHAIKNWQTESLAKARTKAAEQRARQAVEDERKRNLRPGTGKLAERVSEPGTSSAASDAAAAEAPDAAEAETLSRDEARARRRAAMAAKTKK